jgi:hypothetical protein
MHGSSVDSPIHGSLNDTVLRWTSRARSVEPFVRRMLSVAAWDGFTARGQVHGSRARLCAMPAGAGAHMRGRNPL